MAPFNTKIKRGVKGRKDTFKVLKQHIKPDSKTLWFHCASLGEYEQGLPVFEKLRATYTSHTIVLSFFSPSGYDIRKNTPIADVVVYLPLDSNTNAKRFVQTVHPELAIFVKYDIWPNYLNALKTQQIKTILISAVFRASQLYFKPYGTLFKNALLCFDHIFTQNSKSKQLLQSINYNTVSVSGDTRFDRVSNQLATNNSLDFMDTFKQDHLCIIVGSSWPEDEALFINFINSNALEKLKFVIAPHNIKPNQIKTFCKKLNTSVVLYSERHNKPLDAFNILIIDTIGLLSKIYSYADIAYVGGAMGSTGLHNILEPAVFGVPVIIGHNHQKFPEAQAFIGNGGMFAVKDAVQFQEILSKLIQDDVFRSLLGKKNKTFVDKNSGAVVQILDYLRI